MRSVLVDAFAADWLVNAIAAVADGAESWIAGSGRPPVTIDLTEPKQRIRAHPDSPLLVMILAETSEDADMQATGAEAGGSDAGLNQLLADLPDGAALHEAGWWEDVVTRAGDLRHWTLRVGLVGAAVALLTAAAGVALTRRPRSPAVAGWGAWSALWVALPVLTLSWALPAIAGSIPFPDVFSLPIRIVEGAWGTSRLLGGISLGLALLVWALTHVLRERVSVIPGEPEPAHDPEPDLVVVG